MISDETIRRIVLQYPSKWKCSEWEAFHWLKSVLQEDLGPDEPELIPEPPLEPPVIRQGVNIEPFAALVDELLPKTGINRLDEAIAQLQQQVEALTARVQALENPPIPVGVIGLNAEGVRCEWTGTEWEPI